MEGRKRGCESSRPSARGPDWVRTRPGHEQGQQAFETSEWADRSTFFAAEWTSVPWTLAAFGALVLGGMTIPQNVKCWKVGVLRWPSLMLYSEKRMTDPATEIEAERVNRLNSIPAVRQRFAKIFRERGWVAEPGLTEFQTFVEYAKRADLPRPALKTMALRLTKEDLRREPDLPEVFATDARGHAWVRSSGTTDMCANCGCTRFHERRDEQPERDGGVLLYSQWRGGTWTEKWESATVKRGACVSARLSASSWLRRARRP